MMCIAQQNKHQVAIIQQTDMMTIEPTPATSSQRVSRRRSSHASYDSSYGGTDKHAKRTYVDHNYQDHYDDPLFRPGVGQGDTTVDGAKRRGPRGGVVIPFPERLNSMLGEAEAEGFEEIVSWQPHGRCFIVHQPKKFVEEVMPKYFRQSKLTSFQRQVNLYGFRRLTSGTDRGGYYHEMFLRGRPDLHKKLVRTRVKGTGFKSASSPATEPNFYAYQTCSEEGPSNINSRPASVVNADETEDSVTMPPLVLSCSAPLVTVDDPVDPVWEPLCAPPKMVATPMNTSLKIPGVKRSWGSSSFMSLSSMAPTMFRTESTDLTQKQARGIVTPESNLKDLVSVGLKQAMALVIPTDSPVRPSSQPFCDAEDLMEAPLPQGNEELLMDTFEADAEALLSVDTMFADEEMTIDGATFMSSKGDVPSDYAFDPLLLLDEVA